MIVCVAVIGQLNNPLYLKTYEEASSEDETLKFHYIVHCSLDAVEEKALMKRAPNEIADTYLGLLYPTEDYRVYGHMFKKLHSQYVDFVSSPFHTFGQPIKSAKFEAAVDTIIRSYLQTAT